MTNAAKIGNAAFWSNPRQSMKTFTAESGVKENGQQTWNFGFTRKENSSAVDTLVVSLLLSSYLQYQTEVDISDVNRL